MKLPILLVSVLFLMFACGQPTTNTTAQSSIKKVSTEKEISKQLRHVVLFKFKDGTSEADIQKVEMAFSELPNKIPEIKGYEWGINNSPEGLDKGFTHCFFLTFDSEAGRAVYLPHPDHKAFGDVLTPHLADVLVLDYWVQ